MIKKNNLSSKKQLIEILLSKQNDSRLSWNQICKKVGISPSVVSKFLHTSSDISVESLNKLLNFFKVDIFKACRKELKGRVFDSAINVPVVGVANEYGIIKKPGLGDPKSIIRSNLWLDYHSIVCRHDPIHSYQLLFDPKYNLIDQIHSGGDLREFTRFATYSLIEYDDDITTFRMSSVYLKDSENISCIDNPTNQKINRPLKNIKSWYIVESIFAPQVVSPNRSQQIEIASKINT